MTPAPSASPATAPSTKLDPERLVLRARPARAIRFKRGLVIALVALAVSVVSATSWFALRPPALHLAATSDDLTSPARSPGDTISALPDTYAGVPKLGPPLPGDLGRPILERERQLDGAAIKAPATQANDRAETLRAQRRAALQTARESALLLPVATRGAPASPERVTAAVAAGPGGTAGMRGAIDPEGDPGGQQRKIALASGADSANPVNPYALMPVPSPYTLMAGSVISASLITGIRSDVPGLVTAQVTENVYDSATGQILLVPQGARLIGSYDSVVAFGQKRALVVWQRIVLPDGQSLRIDNVPATDPSGYAGLQDRIDTHAWALLKGAALSTLLGVGAELQFTGESDLVQALRQSTQQSVSRAGDQMTSRNLQVQPTITIRPGTPVRLVVHRDLVLAPWKGIS